MSKDVEVEVTFTYNTTVEEEGGKVDYSHILKTAAAMQQELRVWKHDPELRVDAVEVYPHDGSVWSEVFGPDDLPEIAR